MNLFDLVAGLVLLVSAVIGYVRGAVKEVVALFAFTVAAALSIWLLPYTAPVALKTVPPVWVANSAAMGVSFLLIYLLLRLAGSHVSGALRGQATLGALDRTVGLAFGVARALVVLGVVYLVFTATPSAEPPPLLTGARLYPLARGSGVALASLAPGGIRQLQAFGASLKSRMDGETPEPPAGAVEASPPPSDAAPQTAPYAAPASPARHHRHHHPAETQAE